MDTNAVLDLMWVLICGILVFFMQAGFTLVETGQIKEHREYNNENLMDFVSVVSHSGQ
jgi:Amt family ammonium transporter